MDVVLRMIASSSTRRIFFRFAARGWTTGGADSARAGLRVELEANRPSSERTGCDLLKKKVVVFICASISYFFILTCHTDTVGNGWEQSGQSTISVPGFRSRASRGLPGTGGERNFRKRCRHFTRREQLERAAGKWVAKNQAALFADSVADDRFCIR